MLYNDKQLVAMAISGYEPKESCSSAKNDWYYTNCNNEEEKLDQIISISNTEETGNKSPLSMNESIQVMRWLDKSFNGENERYQAFESL